MRVGLYLISRLLMFVVVTSFSSQSLALLDVGAKGNTEDRKELKLLYTFDEAAGANKILNQVHKNDADHPTHLLIRGNKANVTLSNSSIDFKTNSVLNNVDRRFVTANIGSTYQNKTVTIQLKKDIAKRNFEEAVYLESQGDVPFNSLCTNDKEATLQIFFKPKKVNYSNVQANIFRLQNPSSGTGSFAVTQFFNRDNLYSYVNATRAIFRENDLSFGVEQNEAIISVKAGQKSDKYFLLHSEAGKEGWESVNPNDNGGGVITKINNYAGSRVLIGTYALKSGSGAANLISKLDTITTDGPLKSYIQENAGGYVGSIQQVAFYCRHTPREEALGGEYTDTTKIKVTPDLTGEPTQSEKVAVRLLSLITKKKIPVDAAIVKQAAVHISRGDYQKAARIGVELPDFYNNTVKDMGLKMSNREETVDTPLNDFAATMIGVVRDQVNAKQLLTGNFYYRANGLVGVPSDVKTHMLQSNVHYEELDKGGYDLKKALVRVDGQKITGSTGTAVDHPDPAGVLTSRAFLGAHASAGTNRRPVEYTFKQFMCLNLSEVADTESSDLRVGRDIDRFPGGSHKKYQTSCKGCHTVMDGFRGAFAKVDFGTFGRFSYLRHGDLYKLNRVRVGSANFDHPKIKPVNSISYKVNHNEFAFPNGYVTRDDSFYNFANRGPNKILLGWRSEVSKGFGMGQFGKMVSESERFSKCMVKRVFEAVCPVNVDENILSKLGVYVNEFESSGYNLKDLFVNASISPLCIGGN